MNENIKAEKQARSTRSDIYDWIQCIVMAIVICVLFFSFVVRLVDVVIIVFRKDEYREEPLVKRIIAVEGQTVDIDFELGIVYVDGEALDEPYIAEPTNDPEDFYGPVVVPEGCIFVMGDNRNASTDSRTTAIGFVDERCIMGKVYFTVFPLKNFGSDYGG